MYISLTALAYGTLFVLASVALVVLILVLIKLNRVLGRVDNLVETNEASIRRTIASLEIASDNTVSLTHDIKGVGEAITETAATAIATKDSIEDYFLILREVLLMVKKVFSSK